MNRNGKDEKISIFLAIPLVLPWLTNFFDGHPYYA